MTGGMMFKGTPGPWVIGADGERIITDYRDKNGNMVDSNWLKGGWAKAICGLRYASWMKPEEAKNNGHLIAAAPDLLDDGQWLLDRLFEFERELEDDAVAREFYGHVSPAIARFRIAIAKALGEQK